MGKHSVNMPNDPTLEQLNSTLLDVMIADQTKGLFAIGSKEEPFPDNLTLSGYTEEQIRNGTRLVTNYHHLGDDESIFYDRRNPMESLMVYTDQNTLVPIQEYLFSKHIEKIQSMTGEELANWRDEIVAERENPENEEDPDVLAEKARNRGSDYDTETDEMEIAVRREKEKFSFAPTQTMKNEMAAHVKELMIGGKLAFFPTTKSEQVKYIRYDEDTQKAVVRDLNRVPVEPKKPWFMGLGLLTDFVLFVSKSAQQKMASYERDVETAKLYGTPKMQEDIRKLSLHNQLESKSIHLSGVRDSVYEKRKDGFQDYITNTCDKAVKSADAHVAAEKEKEEKRLAEIAEKEAQELAKKAEEDAKKLAEEQAKEAERLEAEQAEKARLLAEEQAKEAERLAVEQAEKEKQLAEEQAREAERLAESQARQKLLDEKEAEVKREAEKQQIRTEKIAEAKQLLAEGKIEGNPEAKTMLFYDKTDQIKENLNKVKYLFGIEEVAGDREPYPEREAQQEGMGYVYDYPNMALNLCCALSVPFIETSKIHQDMIKSGVDIKQNPLFIANHLLRDGMGSDPSREKFENAMLFGSTDKMSIINAGRNIVTQITKANQSIQPNKEKEEQGKGGAQSYDIMVPAKHFKEYIQTGVTAMCAILQTATPEEMMSPTSFCHPVGKCLRNIVRYVRNASSKEDKILTDEQMDICRGWGEFAGTCDWALKCREELETRPDSSHEAQTKLINWVTEANCLRVVCAKTIEDQRGAVPVHPQGKDLLEDGILRSKDRVKAPSIPFLVAFGKSHGLPKGMVPKEEKAKDIAYLGDLDVVVPERIAQHPLYNGPNALHKKPVQELLGKDNFWKMLGIEAEPKIEPVAQMPKSIGPEL